MEVNGYTKLRGLYLKAWHRFMEESGLNPRDDADYTVIAEEDGKFMASGSRCGSILKYIAVDPSAQGLGLTGTVFTWLAKDAFEHGIRHLFLYTKPKNGFLFEESHFYPVAKTDSVLLMEDKRDGIKSFIESLPQAKEGVSGAIVMNCNPFTLGHRYLIETAASQVDNLYVFVLSEDKSEFPASDRLELVRKGTEDLQNVTVLTTGDYLISSATFPDYFLREDTDVSAEQCALDCNIFTKYYAPRLNISKRFAGTEPNSQVTDHYNRTMEDLLPGAGIEFIEIPRLESDGEPISAKRVRALLHRDRPDELRRLVPQTTFDYLAAKELI